MDEGCLDSELISYPEYESNDVISFCAIEWKIGQKQVGPYLASSAGQHQAWRKCLLMISMVCASMSPPQRPSECPPACWCGQVHHEHIVNWRQWKENALLTNKNLVWSQWLSVSVLFKGHVGKIVTLLVTHRDMQQRTNMQEIKKITMQNMGTSTNSELRNLMS